MVFTCAGLHVLVKVVTAFTIAHSLTLGLAWFDLIALPGRLVVVVTREPQADKEHVLFRGGDPKVMLAELEQKGFKEVALIGGGGVNATFLNAGLIDEVYLTLIPRWFGKGVPLFAEGVGEHEFELIESKPLADSELLLHYRLKK